MRRSNKIKASLIVSILIHILVIVFVKIVINNTSYKNNIIAVEYYAVEPAKVAPLKKKSLETRRVKKSIRKPKKIVKPKPKPKPAKKRFTLKEEPEIAAPAKQTEPKKTKIVHKKRPPHEPKVSAAVPAQEKVIGGKHDKEPKEEKFALLKELLRRDELKKRKAAEEGVRYQKGADEKSKKGVKIARILPSMERLEELSRLENENTRKLGDTELETIRLDSANIRYASYLDHIKLAIELAWNYPEAAARRGIEGEGVLSFTIAKEGGLKEIKLLNTTGSKILDDRFLRAVKMAAPFPPIPENIKTRNLNIVATYRYILSIVYR